MTGSDIDNSGSGSESGSKKGTGNENGDGTGSTSGNSGTIGETVDSTVDKCIAIINGKMSLTPVNGTMRKLSSPLVQSSPTKERMSSNGSLSSSRPFGRGVITGQLGNLVGDDGYIDDGSDDESIDSDSDDENERFPEYTSDHMTMRVGSNENNQKRNVGLETGLLSPNSASRTNQKRNIELGSRYESKSKTNARPISRLDSTIHGVLKSLIEYIPQSIPGVSLLNRLIDSTNGQEIEYTGVDVNETPANLLTPPPTLFYGNGEDDLQRNNSTSTHYNIPIPKDSSNSYFPQNGPLTDATHPPSSPRKPSSLVDALRQQQQDAESYSHWLEVSRQLDSLLGNDEWKLQDESDLYDSDLVRYRLEQLRHARETGDMESLLSLVRTTLQRNLGNMGDPRLYQYSYTGTKQLIEDYICECEVSLQTLMASPKIDDTRLLGTLIQTRKAFGRTALVLSGGSTFGVLHIGVLFELWNAKLLPRVISGSSAGSIFASILCIHADEEIDTLLQLLEGDFDIFEKTGSEESTFVRIARFLKYGTWFDNKYISSTLRSLLGDLTFQEAYYRTRRVLNVTVSPSSVHEMPKLLNYLTAPNVLIWSAVCASCSVPLVFASFDILAKNPKTGEHYSWSPATFIDGSVDNDLPLARLSEMFNVNHFIACQVNPHVAPFLKLSEAISGTGNPTLSNSTTSSLTRSVFSRWSDIWTFTQDIISDEVSHFLLILTELGIFKNTSTKFRSVLAQQYSGDITILPQIKWSELGQLFKNPSPAFFHSTKERAAACTWQKVSIIRNHCAIELALDRAILDIRSRLIPHPFAFSEQLATAGRPPRMYHFRRRSEVVLHKALMRKNSWQDVGSKKYWSPSPPFLSAHSSHVSLYSLNPSPAIARYKDSNYLQP